MNGLYNGPVFEMARRQFDDAADRLSIPMDERERVFAPKRAIAVSCPIHRDDGSIAVFQGYRVQHHLTRGPTKGGTRFAPSVDLGEIAALAIWMSWKCALAELPYGGGKGGITVDPYSLSARELEALSRRYMQEMIPFIGPHTDVMAPDMGTNAQIMAWFMDTYSMHQGHTVAEVVTGKPLEVGGTVGRSQSTGRGVAHLIGRAMEQLAIKPQEASAIIQGYGNVGSITAESLSERGVKIVGISDHTSAYYDPRGFSTESLRAHLSRHGTLKGYSQSAFDKPEQLLTQKCDILVPAAIEQVITEANAPMLQCRILAEGANGPTTPRADKILNDRGNEMVILPDILCNAGGVIVSYFEWVQDLQHLFWDEEEVYDRMTRIMERSLGKVRLKAERDDISYRNAALAIGIETVRRAKSVRGLFP